jgi:flagellar motor switch protein FliM
MAGPEQKSPLGAGGDSLSQSDIDRLMAEAVATATKAPPIFRHDGERFSEEEMPGVEAHDFFNPVLIDEPILRALRQRHNEFAAFVSARLSIFLRMDFTLKLQRVATLVYHRFAASVPNPGHVVLFKMEPLAGVGVVDVTPRLGLTIVDRLLGGKGHSVKVPDNLTEIEMNLLDDMLLVMLEEWCRLWGGDKRLNTAIVGRENGGRYLQTSASETVMLVIAFTGSIGDCNERLQIAIPYATIEGTIRAIASSRLASATEPARKERTSAWRSAYNAIPIPLSVEWDAAESSLRDVIALAPGSVMRLPREIIRDTRVRLAGATKFVGEIGVEAGRLAVRIDQKVTSEDV